MLVVLDTNVIVSALHLPESRLANIVTRIQARKIDLAISPFILDELEGVLVSKFRWTKDRAREAKELIRSMAITLIDPSPFIDVVKDSEADNRAFAATASQEIKSTYCRSRPSRISRS
jgi:putative PIN family toxin of toxin-antitoxin system